MMATATTETRPELPHEVGGFLLRGVTPNAGVAAASGTIRVFASAAWTTKVESGAILTTRFIVERQQRLSELIETWHEANDSLSSPSQIANHWAYQTIINDFGMDAVPAILRDLKHRGGHWYRALRAITGASPTTPAIAGNIAAMNQAWFNWAQQMGIPTD